MAGSLLILSGPSCVGKSPLFDALARCHPELELARPVGHTSRAPRPGEQDGVEFWFRTREQIAAYDRGRYFVFPMRNQMRALDLDEIEVLLGECERVVVELHPPPVATFRAHPRVTAAQRVIAVLLQPLSVEEAHALAAASARDVAEEVAAVMRAKQIHRALEQGKVLDEAELADIDLRAAAAWDEMQPGPAFDHVFVNHDAEGDAHWQHTPPTGDAGRTMERVAALLR